MSSLVQVQKQMQRVRFFFVENVFSSPKLVASCPFEIISSGDVISCVGTKTNAKSKIIDAAPTMPPITNPDFAKC